MKQKSVPGKTPADQVIKDIRRQTRRHYSAEEKIRIVLEGLRGEENISELCRREDIAASMYYGWSKEFLEAGKRRLAGDTARAATSGEVRDLRREAASHARSRRFCPRHCEREVAMNVAQTCGGVGVAVMMAPIGATSSRVRNSTSFFAPCGVRGQVRDHALHKSARKIGRRGLSRRPTTIEQVRSKRLSRNLLLDQSIAGFDP